MKTIEAQIFSTEDCQYFAAMKRRQFTQLLGAGLPLGASKAFTSAAPDLVLPARPRAGDKWGLIAPGSPVPRDRIKQAEANVKQLGFQPVVGKHAGKDFGFLAGTDEQRLDDLHNMFADPDIKAIWCLRGGYGCSRLLPHIQYNLIRSNPKPLFGYSDITALHLAFLTQCGLVSFHGPIPAATFGAYNRTFFERSWTDASWHIRPHKKHQDLAVSRKEFRAETLIPGEATGSLVGGNLSLLASLAGTAYSPSYRDSIVFLEDVGEKPYRIDRMLTQLLQATDFSEASAYVLGIFNDCEAGEEDRSLTLKETLAGQFAKLGRPTAYGLPFGHVEEQVTLPQGVEAHFDSAALTLTVLESPFA